MHGPEGGGGDDPAHDRGGPGAAGALLHGLFGAARNLGVVQRALAPRFRVLAMDMRNHGASPHAAAMDYRAMAADVLETLDQRAALPAALVGHSMGGKAAMMAALTQPEQVSRLVVADIAPVAYEHHNAEIVATLAGLKLSPGLTRAGADAALAEAVPDAGLRAFLLQNLVPGAHPGWRIGLHEIAAAMRAIEGWDAPRHGISRPDAVHRGRGVGLRRPGASPGDPRAVSRGAVCHVEARRALAAR